MDNDAFRALVNNQRGRAAKSTKEIAREAVESEFRSKRRHRCGGGAKGGWKGHDTDGYGSDSCGGSSDEGSERDPTRWQQQQQHGGDDDNEPEWKRRRKEKKRQDNRAGGGGDYRDRARERREGTNADYASLEGIAPQTGQEDNRKKQAELSKYLGGDEEHTHLVRGLDKALAERVRRQEMGQPEREGSSKDSGGDGDLDRLFEDSYSRKQQQTSTGGTQHNWQSLQPKTELGRSILSYLLHKMETNQRTLSSISAPLSATQVTSAVTKKTNPTVQKSIQHSILSFSIESDVRHRHIAWDVPRMSLRSFGNSIVQGNPAIDASAGRRLTPLNRHMIGTISRKLNDYAGRMKERNKHHVGDMRTSGNGEKNNRKRDEDKDNRGGLKSKSSADANANNAPINRRSVKGEDDSDEDIFKNAGSYVPRALVPKPSKKPASMTCTVPTTIDGKHKACLAGDDKALFSQTAAGEKSNQTQMETKQSIFDTLLPQDSRHQQRPQLRLQQKYEQQGANRNIIDRDVFGGKNENILFSQYQKRRGLQSAMMDGVSITTYQGGYGEDMDVDFDGMEEVRDRKCKEGEAEDKEMEEF